MGDHLKRRQIEEKGQGHQLGQQWDGRSAGKRTAEDEVQENQAGVGSWMGDRLKRRQSKKKVKQQRVRSAGMGDQGKRDSRK